MNRSLHWAFLGYLGSSEFLSEPLLPAFPRHSSGAASSLLALIYNTQQRSWLFRPRNFPHSILNFQAVSAYRFPPRHLPAPFKTSKAPPPSHPTLCTPGDSHSSFGFLQINLSFHPWSDQVGGFPALLLTSLSLLISGGIRKSPLHRKGL